MQPDLILLDVMMPGVDGWVVLQRLKSHPATANIPVVMCTIVDEPKRGFALGATDFLTKPVDRSRLASVLAKHGIESGSGKVLVVEDDEATRDLLTRSIAKTGCVVDSAENGRIALERLTESIPDLIILDLMMPEMDGFEFVEEMQKEPEWRGIPVVVLTAKGITREDRLRLNGHVAEIMQKEAHDQETMLATVLERVRTRTGGD